MNTLMTLSMLAMAAATPGLPLFEAGNEAYLAGDYARSVSLYEKLVAEGTVSAPVFYNLGNAYLQSGKPGRALAQYKRALNLEPGFREAASNLDFALAEVPGVRDIPELPMWRRVAGICRLGMTSTVLEWLFLSVWTSFWGVLIRIALKPSVRMRYMAAVSGLVSMVFGLAVINLRWPVLLAVAAADPIPVRYTTDEKEPIRFELREGDWVVVDQQRMNWVRVETVSGERGWTQAEGLEFVGPPYSHGPAGTEVREPE